MVSVLLYLPRAEQFILILNIRNAALVDLSIFQHFTETLGMHVLKDNLERYPASYTTYKCNNIIYSTICNNVHWKGGESFNKRTVEMFQ